MPHFFGKDLSEIPASHWATRSTFFLAGFIMAVWAGIVPAVKAALVLEGAALLLWSKTSGSILPDAGLSKAERKERFTIPRGIVLWIGAVCFISFIILICSKVPGKYLLWTVPIAIGAVGVIFTVHELTGAFSRIDTFEARVVRFVSRDDSAEMSAAELQEQRDKTFQEQQAREAIQLGGILGRGPGNSIKRDILPNAYDDYIYSIIVEEYGLAGGAFVIFLYLWFFYRCLKIASSCRKDFSLIAVLGLSSLITLQALLHIFVNTGIIPVTGQTLPMISRGGSSLVIMSSAFGIILSVNRTVEIQDLRIKAEKEAQTCGNTES